MNRRAVVVAVGTAIASLAGCASTGNQQTTRETTPPRGTDGEESSLTDWEATTDCEGEPNDMHDSVVKVEDVAHSVDDEFDPVHFADLTPAEQSIARNVTEAGGYGTCDPSAAFDRLVERVSERTDAQSSTMTVYLERDGVYYALYVEVQDQVYAY